VSDITKNFLFSSNNEAEEKSPEDNQSKLQKSISPE